MHILLTGGTGLLGSFLLPRLLQAYPGAMVTLLLRAKNEGEAASRYAEIRARLPWFLPMPLPDAARERVQWVRGDVGEENLGLAPEQYRMLAGTLTHIVHAAASVRFDMSLDEARAINCGGTQQVLRLARLSAVGGRFERFVYVGTSSVSGRREGVIYEHELEKGQSFFNTYEQSKAESERLVRDSSAEFPVTIARPSIVVGDSRSGRTTTFNVIYIPLRLFARGVLRFMPGRSPDPVLDLVPVDWVCDVLVRGMTLPASVNPVYHLTAGPSRAVPLRTLAALAVDYFNRLSPLRFPRSIDFLTDEEYTHRRSSMSHTEDALFSQLDTLFPYLAIDRHFDTTNADSILQLSGIVFPPFSEYAEKIFGFCLESNWGKRPFG